MKDYVLIRSSKYGLEVHLNDEIPFEELKDKVYQKFMDSAKFFANARVAASFEGRTLSVTEEQELLDILHKAANIEVICIIDNNHTRNILYRSIIEQTLEHNEQKEGQFYRGTLKRRQVLESEEHIVILGNVEAGAKVISKGNIVVLGEIKGHVHAGYGGDDNAYVVALSMIPKSLKINETAAKRHILQEKNDIPNLPKIATLDGEHIYVDPLI